MSLFSRVACLFAIVFVPAVASIGFAGERPNVLLIITDDQGYGDVGFHGNQMLKTPNLDDLARESVRLTNFHVDPTCAETRSALMTGRYSTRVGVWHTINGRSLLPADEVTMAEVFANNGYRTGMFGKWHLGDNWPLRPRDQGFQQTLIHGGGGVGQTPDAWGNDYFDDRYFENGKLKQQSGYCTDVFFSAAESFIRASDEPFFCYLSTNAPHGPFLVDDKYAKPYREQGAPSPMAEFYGMIADIDENLGQLLKSLTEQGKAENTIVIFMTDNGTAAGYAPWLKDDNPWKGYNAQMRETKGSHYDGGHRVPCFVRWPAGELLTDKSLPQLTAHIDLLPTLLELCDLEGPKEVALDGESLTSLLKADPDANSSESEFVDRTLIVNSQRVDVPEKWRKCSVMQGDWRLVNKTELYNLANDPGQSENVAEANPERVAAMQQSYEAWWKAIAPSFDKVVRIPIGAKESPITKLTCHDWHATYGIIPWNQETIAKDIEANGYWTLEVMQAGTYEIELRDRPAGVDHQFAEGSARLKMGDQKQTQTIEANTEVLRFKVALPAGPADLTTAIEETGQSQHGAYYVTIRKLEAE